MAMAMGSEADDTATARCNQAYPMQVFFPFMTVVTMRVEQWREESLDLHHHQVLALPRSFMRSLLVMSKST